MVTATKPEVFPGFLQTEQKYIGKWRKAIKVELSIVKSELFNRLVRARYVVGSIVALKDKNRCPVHFVAEKPYELLCKMFTAVKEKSKDE